MLVVGVGKSWSDKQISLLANYPGEKLINQNYFLTGENKIKRKNICMC